MKELNITVDLPNLEGIHGWLSQREACLLNYGVKITSGLLGELLEIGSYCGKSTVVIAHAAQQYRAGLVYAIDPHTYRITEGLDSYEELVKNLTRLHLLDRVSVIRNYSTKVVVDELLKFVFIDGDHSYEEVKKDWLHIRDNVVMNGLVLFHDCDEVGPATLVSEIFNQDHEFQFSMQVDSMVGFRRVRSS